LAIVHNGIIENHESMRGVLRERGYEFQSDTDTEVIAHLLHDKLRTEPDLLAATRAALAELQGAYAVAVVAQNDPTRIVVARKGAPLLLGLGDGEYFAASDVSALLQVTQRVIYLEEGDVAELSLDGYRITDEAGLDAERTVHVSELTSAAVELGPYRHYMQKEIFEQPGALANTLELVANAKSVSPQLFGAEAAAVFGEVDS